MSARPGPDGCASASRSTATWSSATRSSAPAPRASASLPADVVAARLRGQRGRLLHATGVPEDCRMTEPYLFYDQLDVSTCPVGRNGDCFDRFAILIARIDASLRIIEQVHDRIPPGPVNVKLPKVVKAPEGRDLRPHRDAARPARLLPGHRRREEPVAAEDAHAVVLQHLDDALPAEGTAVARHDRRSSAACSSSSGTSTGRIDAVRRPARHLTGLAGPPVKIVVIVLASSSTVAAGRRATSSTRSWRTCRPGWARWRPAASTACSQLVADGIKFIQKEDIIPTAADKWVFALAPGGRPGPGHPGLRASSRYGPEPGRRAAPTSACSSPWPCPASA